MRIVLIGPVYPYRGGIAHHTALLERSLHAANHEVLVISFKRQYPRWLYPGSTDRDPSSTPLHTPAEYLLDPLYPWTWRLTRRRIAAFSPDLVVIQWWTTFWSFAFASLRGFCQRQRIPVAYILHNVLPHEQRPWDAWLAQRALRGADTVIAQNPNEADRLLELLPAAHVRTCEMPLYSSFTGDPLTRQAARHRLGIPADSPMLLFFGIVRPYKGLHVLLDALGILNRQVQAPLLIAAGEFWEDARSYRSTIHELGLDRLVRIEDRYIPNEEVDVFFSAADVLIAPYLAGTQSAAVALALGRRLPVILTERIAAGVSPAFTGLTRVVPAGDATALSQAIQAILEDLPRLQPLPLDPQADWMRMVHLLETLGGTGHTAEAAL
jgi:glycosyltransferase involved in cell wall biosynthesis